MGVVNLNNLVIVASLLVVIILTGITLGLVTEGPVEEEDIKQTACYRAASQGSCDLLDEQMGEGTRQHCCEVYDKCC